jgi:hypothetical protein
MPNVMMLNVVMLNVVILNAVMLGVIVFGATAKFNTLYINAAARLHKQCFNTSTLFLIFCPGASGRSGTQTLTLGL